MIQRLRPVAACVALIALGWPITGIAQTSGAETWQGTELLNGRLIMDVPATARAEGVEPANIMGAAPAGESLSRLRIAVAGTEIVAEARELFAIFPSDPAGFFHDVVLGGTPPGDAPAPGFVQLAPQLTAYGIAAGSYHHPSGNHVLANLLVAQPDGTAQHIYMMTWDKPAATVQEASRIAKRMIASLRPGPRQGLASGGSRLLTQVPQANGSSRNLTITLPEGYVMSVERGPDFTVYNINKLAPLDLPGGGLGIYIGTFPSYFYAQHGYKPEDLTKVPATILGRDTTWLERHAEAVAGRPGWTHRETILPLQDSEGGLKLHVFASVPDDSGQLAELTRIAEEDLRLTPP